MSEQAAERGAGFVSLVGAGPGDPELLTVRAVNRLGQAEVVVHDRLVSAQILNLANPAARRVDVGKQPGKRSPRQADITALLVQLGLEGQRVVRLKGGDPFVFGRGGEEALALHAAGVSFEVVPGISSALAAPLAAGIPVTHRGLSAAVTIATGHAEAGRELAHDWSALARVRGTLVFLMAVEGLPEIVERLMEHGRHPDEPAAIVEAASTPRQRVVEGTLASIVAVARDQAVHAPATLVVGPTVPLGTRLRARSAAGAGSVAASAPMLI